MRTRLSLPFPVCHSAFGFARALRRFPSGCLRQAISFRSVRQFAPRGFTLVEVLVATAILATILVMTLSMIDGAGRLTRHTRARIETFQEARTAFEAMTRNLSQAILNTYWDYEYPNGNTALAPSAYVRNSELHFIADKAQSGSPRNLLAGTTPSSAPNSTVTHSVFFQTPRGFSESTGRPLDTLLNAFGYFVQFGSDADLRPPFLDPATAPLRYRYRLMEMMQPSENLTIYADFATFKTSNTATLLNAWFLEPLKRAPQAIPTDPPGPPTHVLAENVIALVIQPMRSPNDPAPTGAPAELAPNYLYDSRAYLRGTGGVAADLQALTRSQIPPMVKVTMVALDEASAARLQGASTTAPTIPVDGGRSFGELFETTANYASDLADLEKGLADAHLGYRVFTTNVSILQAKWSE